MKTPLAISILLVGALFASGCATKKYVRNTAEPIQAKVDQVGEQANRNTVGLEDARKEIKAVDEKAETGISAARERAMTAENKANDAMNKATEAGTMAADARSRADSNKSEIASVNSSLKNAIANIDDYKPIGETTVTFAFGKDKLSPEAKDSLDKLAGDKARMKRFVVAVEGFTDKTGSVEYNTALSQRRAGAVVNYLVTQHNIPLYRIYNVGLGSQKLADEGKGREARSKNRRVEVKFLSADDSTVSSSSLSPNAEPTR